MAEHDAQIEDEYLVGVGPECLQALLDDVLSWQASPSELDMLNFGQEPLNAPSLETHSNKPGQPAVQDNQDWSERHDLEGMLKRFSSELSTTDQQPTKKRQLLDSTHSSTAADLADASSMQACLGDQDMQPQGPGQCSIQDIYPRTAPGMVPQSVNHPSPSSVLGLQPQAFAAQPFQVDPASYLVGPSSLECQYDAGLTSSTDQAACSQTFSADQAARGLTFHYHGGPPCYNDQAVLAQMLQSSALTMPIDHCGVNVGEDVRRACRNMVETYGGEDARIPYVVTNGKYMYSQRTVDSIPFRFAAPRQPDGRTVASMGLSHRQDALLWSSLMDAVDDSGLLDRHKSIYDPASRQFKSARSLFYEAFSTWSKVQVLQPEDQGHFTKFVQCISQIDSQLPWWVAHWMQYWIEHHQEEFGFACPVFFYFLHISRINSTLGELEDLPLHLVPEHLRSWHKFLSLSPRRILKNRLVSSPLDNAFLMAYREGSFCRSRMFMLNMQIGCLDIELCQHLLYVLQHSSACLVNYQIFVK